MQHRLPEIRQRISGSLIFSIFSREGGIFMIYLTGDTHGKFDRIAEFCETYHTTKDDLLIILGDAGFNFSGGLYDHKKKMFVSALPITVFCIHGNHEQRPQNIPSYFEQEWKGGIVYREELYPDILFAKDGEIYDLDGQKAGRRHCGSGTDLSRRFRRGVPCLCDHASVFRKGKCHHASASDCGIAERDHPYLHIQS